MKITDADVGKALRNIRETLGISQAALADRVEGFYPQTITKIESGRRSLKFSEALALADALGIDVQSLATGDLTTQPDAGRDLAVQCAADDLRQRALAFTLLMLP